MKSHNYSILASYTKDDNKFQFRKKIKVTKQQKKRFDKMNSNKKCKKFWE